MSTQINELATALSKFQGEVPKIPMNRTNPFFKSKYADLAGILEIVRPFLAKNNLAVAQLVDYQEQRIEKFDKDGLVEHGLPDIAYGIIQTILVHSSGQFLKAATPFNCKGKPQEQGAQITYMRRYALSAILSIAADDDIDGNDQQQCSAVHEEKTLTVEEAKAAANIFAETIKAAKGKVPPKTKEEWKKEFDRIHNSLPPDWRTNLYAIMKEKI